MHRTPCEQSDRSLLRLCATSVLAVGIVVCAVSSVYAFSVGPLPGLNCDVGIFPRCDLAPTLVQYEEVHQKITREALLEVRFTPPSGGAPVVFSTVAMLGIEDANARTDYNQGDHSLHFDNSFLNEGGNRLIKGKELLLGLLQRRSTLSPKEVIDVRKLLGWYLPHCRISMPIRTMLAYVRPLSYDWGMWHLQVRHPFLSRVFHYCLGLFPMTVREISSQRGGH